MTPSDLGQAGLSRELTDAERHILEHSVGFRSREPFFRNHFVAGEGHSDWATIQDLVSRGLMRVSREPSELSGGDYVFQVTDPGKQLLGKPPRARHAAAEAIGGGK